MLTSRGWFAEAVLSKTRRHVKRVHRALFFSFFSVKSRGIYPNKLIPSGRAFTATYRQIVYSSKNHVSYIVIQIKMWFRPFCSRIGFKVRVNRPPPT